MDTNPAAIHDRSLSPNPVTPDRRSSAEGYVRFRELAELDEPGLLRVQGQVEPTQPLSKRVKEALRVLLSLEVGTCQVST